LTGSGVFCLLRAGWILKGYIMCISTFSAKASPRLRATLVLAVLALALAFPCGVSAGLFSRKPPVVPKWTRFERTFKSNVTYSNALQDATLKVRFVSPLGESFVVDGFWDGGKVWRVRFAPDQPGRWAYSTTCSDAANRGLNGQSGQFLCTAPVGRSRFRQHGPVRVARDLHHLDHADGTPFFWLADTTWDGARVSAPKDWDLYARVRASQEFSVVQWAVAPGKDEWGQTAFTGYTDRIAINPEFFKRLDAKLERLSQSGLLSAIVPLAELENEGGATLPDAQAALLVRYIVARWGAEPVAWLLAFDGDTQGKKVGRWKRIGNQVFADIHHAPVVLYPGQAAWMLDEFRDQAWVNVFGLQAVSGMTDDALKFTFAGPYPKEWTKQPARPLIAFTPLENGVAMPTKKRISSDEVRHAAYWSLLLAPPAGVSYGGQGVVKWDTQAEPADKKVPGSGLPMWQKAMFMPAARQMFQLSRLMNSVDFWKLRPEPSLVAVQPGDNAPSQWVAAAATPANDLAVVYVPGEKAADLTTERLPSSPALNWFNPRTGANVPAAAVVGTTCQVPTPEAGDWVLVLKAGAASK
jgi:hypothetical protein